MGEIDTKSIESVQAALCFFGEKNDLIKCRSNSYDEFEKEKELKGLLTDLANCKVQLEAKDSAHKQALFDLAHYKKTADELSTLLEISEFERDIYINNCKVARKLLDELDSKMREMSDQFSETIQIREQLSHVTVKLKSTQEEFLSAATQLAEAREAKLEAMTQAELMETALSMEKMKTEELLRHVSELNETILHLKMAAVEAEKENCEILSNKEGKLLLATESVIKAQEQLQLMRKEIEMMENLEIQTLEKSLLTDLLLAELQQANELRSSAEGDVSDAINDINRLKSDLELKGRENLDQVSYIKSLKVELNKVKLELENANEELHRLNCEVEAMTGELEKIKSEVEEISGRETEAQVEIALLKSELHKGRSKIAAAEAAEERAKGEKSGVYLALQQLALEAEEAKKENRRLKEEASKAAEETENSSEDDEVTQIDDSKTEADTHVTISVEEYEALVKKAEKADQVPEPVPGNSNELEILKKDLEAAMARIGEFRTRAEQATSRAEVAEMGKAALEEQIRRWRQHKERRNAALAALRQDSISRESYSIKYDDAPKPYQPLGKVLNMKF